MLAYKKLFLRIGGVHLLVDLPYWGLSMWSMFDRTRQQKLSIKTKHEKKKTKEEDMRMSFKSNKEIYIDKYYTNYK